MTGNRYLMESEQEILRLELKTDEETVLRQAAWAGLKPGMRVLDVACGTGKTSAVLRRLAGENGSVLGVDSSPERIAFATEHYGAPGLTFQQCDITATPAGPERFDFIWVRFVLEYHREGAAGLIRDLARQLNPGGILCLIDLDYNCMTHYGLSGRLERAIRGVLESLQDGSDFDPYAGRKLYAHLFDLGLEQINVEIRPHHLIFGELRESDAFNWMRKLEVAARNSGFPFAEYPGGYDEFRQEFTTFFHDPRRFTYTPVISCRGCRPVR